MKMVLDTRDVIYNHTSSEYIFFGGGKVSHYDRKSVEERFILTEEEVKEHPVRNIVIMYKRIWQNGKTKNLEIYGADVFSQKIVKLVDNYGSHLNMCRDDAVWKNIQRNSVIQVSCVLKSDSEYMNTLVIKSAVKKLEKPGLNILPEKSVIPKVKNAGL